MSFLVLLFLNGLFLVALLFSVYIATAWGEVAGHLPGGDKTALGGFFVVFIFMGLRWATLGLLLWAGVGRGGFDEWLAGSRGRQLAIILGAHLAIGLVSGWSFNALVSVLTSDHAAPRVLTALLGVVLPIPALLAAGYAIQRDWVARHPRLALVLALAVVLCHALAYRDRVRDMDRNNARRAAAEAAAP